MTSSNFKKIGTVPHWFVAAAAASLLAACSTSQYAGTTLSQPEAGSDPLELARDIHEEVLVLDAHADIVLPSTSSTYLASDGLPKTDISKLQAGGMDAVVMAIAVGPGPRTMQGDAAAKAEAEAKLAAITELARSTDNVSLASSPAAIEMAHANDKTVLILGFQNARALGGNVMELDRYYRAGVRVFGLNHMGHNDFSDSSRPFFNGETGSYEVTEEHGGLSDLGKAAVRRINRLGAVVDISQMSKAATLQTLDISTTPVIASHSNVRALSNVSRNLSDEEIDRIGTNGGVIHIASFGAYLVDLSDPELLESIRQVRSNAGIPEAWAYPYELYWEIPDPKKRLAFLMAMRKVIGPGSVDRMIDHIDYIVARIGVDHVGIGTDFNHGGGVAGFNDASEASNVTAALVERGYSRQDIAKIWGGNFMRVFRQAAAAASAKP
ncbi:membrane dipeptidase [Parasphingorhabdus sp.]|uniref:dipeptidase n=1 Tax=Parasphingorhabdus sp. TaxID=2709688 RepID=UPI003263A006